MDNNSEPQPMPNGSEPFRTVPQTSESFGKVPHAAESFGNLSNTSERTDSHTLTVREVARMFEAAGVARTERSIVNWCQPNPQGMARLDAFFDTNDRRWFITPPSVESAIAEEQAKAGRPGEPVRDTSAPVRKFAAETRQTIPDAGPGSDQVKTLEQELMDLKILNGGKDYVIEQMRKERDGFIEQVIAASRKVGQLESRLQRLEAPEARLPNHAEGHDVDSATSRS